MDINDLIKLLPEGYENACYKTKAMTRKRTIKNPLDLLRLILFYLSGNKSLIDVSQFALMSGIGKISDVGFMKRFVKCKDWIIWLTHHILPNPLIQYKKPEWLKPYQVLAVDASDIVEKGAVKKLWHLHYALDIFSLTCCQFKITQQSTGESLKNFKHTKGCLVIADRAYGTIKSIEHCIKAERKLSDETVFTHSYMFVITSLPLVISAAEILSCYRLRWQVEMAFIEKRKTTRQQLICFT